jgi:diguanylate cyclase (GGDEF)-like protein
VKLVPYVNSNGNNDGYLVVVEDITKKKQLHLQLEMLNQSLEEKVNSRTRQLQEELLKRKMLEKKLRYLADYDPLTSLLNRRSFTKRVDYEIKRCHRYKSDLSYLIIDIDKFKLINDTYGHLTGDAVLKAFAKKISGILRETDFIGRIGGEEFAVVLPGTGITAADEMGERIRKQIAEHTVQYNNVSINYTVSIGVSVFALKEECMNEAFNRADSALYHAKNTGRNKVCVYT